MTPEAIARLAYTLDSLDLQIRTVDAKAKRSEKNRLSMLHLHALAACVIAPLFASLGREGMAGPAWVLARNIPYAPYSLAALLLTGGIILGYATWHRMIRWEMLGLWMLLSWYGILALSFAGAQIVWIANQGPGPRPALYGPAVYSHLTIVMMVHLRTLRRMARSRARAEQANQA